MIRPFVRIFSFVALSAFTLIAYHAAAQTQVPAAPAQTAIPPAGGQPAAPAPVPTGPPVFPKPDPANFTAPAPTRETIDAFLTANWGYDDDRMWSVQAVQKTPVDGVSKVVVFVGDKSGKVKPAALDFFALPDGKHIITGDQIVPFGVNPFADARQQVQQRADGPYRGAASKDLELVEFADFQCPHCKEAQANMDKLVADFPNARIVFQNDPIASIHPESVHAAEYGVCVSSWAAARRFSSMLPRCLAGRMA